MSCGSTRARSTDISSLRGLLAAILVPAVIHAFWSCSGDKQHFVANVGDGYSTPTMATRDVSTLISDSGYTRYHLKAPVWNMFEDADEPFWTFPEGISLEQYDNNMAVTSNVDADSAVYYSRKKIWRLDGNVVMVNPERDSFLTQQLFWDQNRRKIYSDSFIHIVRSDRTIEGYGFESDQNMASYSVTSPTAILPAKRTETKSDTAAADTTAKAAPKPAHNRHSAIADPQPAIHRDTASRPDQPVRRQRLTPVGPL